MIQVGENANTAIMWRRNLRPKDRLLDTGGGDRELVGAGFDMTTDLGAYTQKQVVPVDFRAVRRQDRIGDLPTAQSQHWFGGVLSNKPEAGAREGGCGASYADPGVTCATAPVFSDYNSSHAAATSNRCSILPSAKFCTTSILPEPGSCTLSSIV